MYCKQLISLECALSNPNLQYFNVLIYVNSFLILKFANPKWKCKFSKTEKGEGVLISTDQQYATLRQPRQWQQQHTLIARFEGNIPNGEIVEIELKKQLTNETQPLLGEFHGLLY